MFPRTWSIILFEKCLIQQKKKETASAYVFGSHPPPRSSWWSSVCVCVDCWQWPARPTQASSDTCIILSLSDAKSHFSFHVHGAERGGNFSFQTVHKKIVEMFNIISGFDTVQTLTFRLSTPSRHDASSCGSPHRREGRQEGTKHFPLTLEPSLPFYCQIKHYHPPRFSDLLALRERFFFVPTSFDSETAHLLMGLSQITRLKTGFSHRPGLRLLSPLRAFITSTEVTSEARAERRRSNTAARWAAKRRNQRRQKKCNTVRSRGERNEAAILFECSTIVIVQKTDVTANPWVTSGLESKEPRTKSITKVLLTNQSYNLRRD